jgi:hypothetical protein
MPMPPCVKPINPAQSTPCLHVRWFPVGRTDVHDAVHGCSLGRPAAVPPVDLPPVTERGGGRRTAGATQFGEHHPAGAGTTSHQAPHRPRDQALGEQTPAGNGQAAGGRRRSDHPALAQPSTTIAPRQGSCKTDGNTVFPKSLHNKSFHCKIKLQFGTLNNQFFCLFTNAI